MPLCCKCFVPVVVVVWDFSIGYDFMQSDISQLCRLHTSIRHRSNVTHTHRLTIKCGPVQYLWTRPRASLPAAERRGFDLSHSVGSMSARSDHGTSRLDSMRHLEKSDVDSCHNVCYVSRGVPCAYVFVRYGLLAHCVLRRPGGSCRTNKLRVLRIGAYLDIVHVESHHRKVL